MSEPPSHARIALFLNAVLTISSYVGASEEPSNGENVLRKRVQGGVLQRVLMSDHSD
jgi:hypothetical protein